MNEEMLLKQAQEIFEKVVQADPGLRYVPRVIDPRFVAYDVYADNLRFDLFYYLIDTRKAVVYHGDYALPEKVMTERTLFGLEIPYKV